MNLSICLIAYNEQKRLPALLESVPKNLEIILIDSGSTDDTVKIAEQYKAKVFQNEFKNHGDQRNFALTKASNDWVLSLDPDEIFHYDLKEIESIINNTQGILAAKIDRHLVFMGKRLKHGNSSDRPIRLFNRKKCQYIGEIHEKIDVKAEHLTSLKKSYLDHYSYEDLTDYFHRFNRYTSLVADTKKNKPYSLSHVFKPFYVFLYRYIFRLGFLDGYPGYTYALISSLYSFIKYAKHYEKKLTDAK